MFALEVEMKAPVAQWMQTHCLHVVEELGTGWGICDLVGCQFDEERVAYRTRHRQRQPLGSAESIRVYSMLPDADTSTRGISVNSLRNRLGPHLDTNRIEQVLTRLVETNHATRTRSGCYLKVNGWAPLATRLIAIELKLHRWTDALWQAKSNQAFAPESFVAFPLPDARRAAMGTFGIDLRHHGIGLLGVCTSQCEVLIEAQRSDHRVDGTLALWATEYFWRLYRGKH